MQIKEIKRQLLNTTAMAASGIVSTPPKTKRRKPKRTSKESTVLFHLEEKLAKDIKWYLGIYMNRSFHDGLTQGEKEEAGRRLESLLDVVADGALIPLLHFTLDKNQVQKLANLKDSASPLIVDHLNIQDGDNLHQEDKDFDFDPLADLSAEPEAKVQTKEQSRKNNEKNPELKVHKKVKYFNCEHCNYQTSEKGNLKRHFRTVHERARNFICDKCGYAASQKDGLKQHVARVHEGEKEFVCDQCNFKSRWKHTLAYHHNAAHKKIRNWACDACNYKSSMKAHLTLHMKRCHTKSTDKFEKCQLCQFAATSEKSLTEHLMMTHVNNHFLNTGGGEGTK